MPGKPVPLSLTPHIYLGRLSALAALQAAWSPVCAVGSPGAAGSLSYAALCQPVSLHSCENQEVAVGPK